MPAASPPVPSFLATDQHAQQIVEQANDAIFVYDLEGRFVDANQAAYTLSGYTRSELLRLNVRDIELSFDLDQGPRRWRELAVGQAVTLEGINRRKDGSIFPAEARISVVETRAGRLLLALVRDVSERKRADALLHLRAQQQQAIASLGAEALSGKALHALLHDALQIVGQTLNLELCRVLEHMPERGGFTVRADLQGAENEQGSSLAPDSTESVSGYVWRTGEPLVVPDCRQEKRVRSTPWLLAEKALCGMSVPVGSMAPRYGVLAAYSREPRAFTPDDVYFVQSVANVLAAAIARHRSEEALREVETRYQRIAAITAGMVFQLVMKPDGSTTIPFVSEGSRQVYGLEPAGLQAEPRLVHWLVHPEDKETYRQVIRRTVATQGLFHWEGRVVHQSGAVRWVTARAKLEPQPDGNVNWDGVVLDVTELKQAQEALLTAKEEAERANAAKSRFLSRMSHELRTPLNAILGFGQVLELSPRDQTDAQCVDHILKGGKHLLSLIDEVLDLTRVEAGEMALDLQGIPFAKLVHECTEFVSKMAQARGITCTAEIGPACRHPVRADERRLRQILLNLLSNAIKYDREGGRVVVRCQLITAGKVRCSISDTGRGISPENLRRLFVPFERLGQELSGTEGLGLGLVVSRRLAEAMGGEVGAESQLGTGSTFWVEMPVFEAAENPDPGGSLPLAKVEAARKAGTETATVLYVEDNASNLQVMQTVVQRLRPHWRFLSASDGKSGLQLACEQRPDAVLLDLELPGMKGDEVLTALRTETDTARIPVLLLSADATYGTRERLLELGADGYLSKPFVVADLLQQIDGLITAAI